MVLWESRMGSGVLISKRVFLSVFFIRMYCERGIFNESPVFTGDVCWEPKRNVKIQGAGCASMAPSCLAVIAERKILVTTLVLDGNKMKRRMPREL